MATGLLRPSSTSESKEDTFLVQFLFLRLIARPLQESDNLHLVPEGYEFEPGLDTVMANGHTTAQQLPRITDGTKTLIFVADLLPTHVHLPLAWVMGYDMRPLETLDEKARFLNEAIEKEWFLYLEHDIEKEIITISTDGRKYTVKDSLTLNEL